MKQDQLLVFLSEKGKGTWAELKEAWTWLTGDSSDPADAAWIVARDLAALGHVEVSWGTEIAWAAAPPLVTMLPRSGGRAFITGARTRHLYWPAPDGSPGGGRLLDLAERLDVWIDACPSASGPSTLYAACRSHVVAERLAESLGIPYTYAAADSLARLLPSLADALGLSPQGELPRGFDTERFDPGIVDWVPSGEPEGFGLYRCRTYSGHVHALYGPAGARRVVRELGIYEVLRWDEAQVLAYDHERYELRVPGPAALPAVHARAVTLCSGRLPERRFPSPGEFELRHPNVPPDVAERVASSLGQALQPVG
jgi:hypothetical protein